MTKYFTGALVAMLWLGAVNAGHALVRIADDRGGQVRRYVDRYERLRASGQPIIIDGLCASACTIVLGTIPHHKICVTPKANLAFHGAWDFGARGRAIPNRLATEELFLMYPSPIRRWIADRGGLSQRTIFLRGRQLAAMYRPCNMAIYTLSTHNEVAGERPDLGTRFQTVDRVIFRPIPLSSRKRSAPAPR